MGKYRFNGGWYTSERIVGPNDERRHKSRCKHAIGYCKNYYCTLYGEKCYSSIHCDHYEDRKNVTYVKTDMSKVMDKNKIRIDIPPYYPMRTKMRMPGTMVKHRTLGFGTVRGSNGDVIEVDFFKNGEKRRTRLSLDLCLRNNAISLYEYGK